MEDTTQQQQPLTWPDGQGRSWQIHADPDTVVLTHADERVELPQSEWRDAITFAPTSTRVVIHFDTGQQEIGFLVPLEEAKALFVAMKQPGTLEQQTEPTPQPSHEVAATDPAIPQRPFKPLWPKMTAMPIVAVSLASISFFPIVGAIFGIAACALAMVIRRRSPINASHHHIRTIATISLYVAIVGMMISAISTYAMFYRPVEALAFDPEMARSLEWSWGARIAAIVMVILALSFHEAAHAITAWWCGDDHAKSMGRVTLSPLSHIDPFGTIILPIMLTYMGMPVFGYARPVPVQLGMVPKYRRAHILISAAGPFSNLLQAACCLALLVLIAACLALMPNVQVYHLCDIQPMVTVTGVAGASVIGAAALMLKLGFAINLMLAFFNLIPIPPLDGSWIAEHMLPDSMGRFYAAIRPYGMFIFLALIWYGDGILLYFLLPAIKIIVWSRELIYEVSGYF
ncbi:MAG: site-2 protease family protein [Planctomycetes bacterium]|nr:site-2 protease family protein [Planctomycetota bacterium]